MLDRIAIAIFLPTRVVYILRVLKIFDGYGVPLDCNSWFFTNLYCTLSLDVYTKASKAYFVHLQVKFLMEFDDICMIWESCSLPEMTKIVIFLCGCIHLAYYVGFRFSRSISD